jgi:hypothetical protein
LEEEEEEDWKVIGKAWKLVRTKKKMVIIIISAPVRTAPLEVEFTIRRDNMF